MLWLRWWKLFGPIPADKKRSSATMETVSVVLIARQRTAKAKELSPELGKMYTLLSFLCININYKIEK